MKAIVDGDGILYRASWKVADVTEALEKYNSIFNTYVDEVWADSSVNYLGAADNWRYNVFPGYKATRKSDPKRAHETKIRKELQQLLIDTKQATPSLGCEADDLVRRKAKLCLDRGQDFCVISSDKDLDCIIGKHMMPTQYGKITHYDIDEVQSDYNYFMQLMIGDMTDNIKSPRLLGKATAKKILDGNPRGTWRKLVEKEYKERCGSEWEHALYFTGSLIHIQRWKDDMFSWNKKDTFYTKGFKGAPTCYGYTVAQLGG